MQHPSSDQVQKVISKLESVLPLARHPLHLDMSQGVVNRHGYSCGSIHCHGGWYAIATLGLRKRNFLLEYIFPQPKVDYRDGAAFMAADLGFIHTITHRPTENERTNGYNQITHWARIHSTIWGNEQGAYMFSHGDAFRTINRPNGALCLQGIIDHWKEVRSRLVAMEQAMITEPEINHTI